MGLVSVRNFSVLVVLSLVVTFSESKYAFIETCSRNDPNLNACILEKAAIVGPKILKGVPEIELPRLDPLYIESVTIQAAQDLTVTAKDIYVYGLDTYKCLDVKADLEKRVATSHLQFDNITLISQYNLNGKVIILDLSGLTGPIYASLENVDLNVTLHWDLYEKKGIIYSSITTLNFTHDVKKVNIDLQNFFGKNDLLSKEVNTFINANWQRLAKDFDGAARQAIEIILNQINAVLKYIPYDELLPDI